MIQRAVTAIIGVVIGLFATFAVFGSILGGLDNFYLLTQDSCNYGTANAPKRVLRLAKAPASPNADSPDHADWENAVTLAEGPAKTTFTHCTTTTDVENGYGDYITPNGDTILIHQGDGTIPNPNVTLGAGAIFGTSTLTWIAAEEVFTAQKQLVTLLAVIAALGMPIGAMTAVVFFGQAVVSSGVSGQGASQVLVAIAAVVVILVAVQMFEQFAGYLGDAFDAVDGNRFVVFNETLGSLAVTISEFWGVLAFAGLINIATIVWRNYSGNFSIGGGGGGGGL